MTEVIHSREAEAGALCMACGLCCTGHLFSWVRLKAIELTPLERLGLNVIRNDPRQRGFTQPCRMWNGVCTIYESYDYPRGCKSYRCKLLRELLDESVEPAEALKVVKQARTLFRTVEKQLPKSTHSSFRERFIAQVKALKDSSAQGHNAYFVSQAETLLTVIETRFGVMDFFDKPEEH